MKKLLLLIPLSTISFGYFAQSSVSVTNASNSAVLTDLSVVNFTTTVGGLADELDFTIKNISGGSKDYHIRRTDIALNKISVSTGDTAIAYFCFGTACFPETTTITPTPYTLVSNGSESLKTYLQEASVAGYSSVKYEIFDVNNVNDLFTFTINYNAAVSVKENSVLFTSTNVYPNPSNNSASIKIQSYSNLKNAAVSITNSLGSIVYSNNLELNVGENTVRLATENLPSGIYFTTISSDKTKIIKKFVINK